MSPTHEPFDELAACYALGALDGDDLTRFEAHLARGCTECEHALAQCREALVQPAVDLREVPPPRVKRALMERLARSRARRPRPARLGPGLKWVAGVAVAAGLIASVVATYVSARYEQRLGEMAREASALREQISQQRQAPRTVRYESVTKTQEARDTAAKQVPDQFDGAITSQQRQALSLLRDPATRIITLAGLEPSPAAQGRMIWNAHDGGILVAAGLPPAPQDKAYELWAVVGGKPIPAGLFGVDAEGRGSARVEPLAGGPEVAQFAVTLEPAGGVPAPTGPMYLASK